MIENEQKRNGKYWFTDCPENSKANSEVQIDKGPY